VQCAIVGHMMNTDTQRKLTKLRKNLEKKREAEQAAWDEMREAVKDAYAEGGTTFQEIGDTIGVTKARVYQIVTGKRSGAKAEATA
jgi:hypothetical protein